MDHPDLLTMYDVLVAWRDRRIDRDTAMCIARIENVEALLEAAELRKVELVLAVTRE